MKKTSKVFISLLLAFTMLLCIPGGAVWAENATSVSSEIGTENPEAEKLGTEDPKAEKPEPENQDAVSSDAENYEVGNSANEVLDNSQPEGASEENKAEAGRLEDKNKLAAGGALGLLPATALAAEDSSRIVWLGEPVLEPKAGPIKNGVVTFTNLTQNTTLQSSRERRVASDSYAYVGDKIKVTAVPDSGYYLDEIWIQTLVPNGESLEEGTTILGKQVGTGDEWSYEFDMPSGDYVIVCAWAYFGYDASYIKHAVTIADTQNGTVTADKETARAGETVKLTVMPEEGAELKSLTVTKASGGEVTVTDDQFTMPAENVTVNATFAKKYTISINGSGCTVTVDKEKAEEGETVTLTAVAQDGYYFDPAKAKVEYGGGNYVDLTQVDETTFTFIMPAANINGLLRFSAYTRYPVQINGKWITAGYLSDEGWSYEGNENGGTLTLNNADLTQAQVNSANIYIGAPLTIVLEGENKLTASLDSGKGISATSPVTIKGSGSLTATGSFAGIQAQNGLTIEDGANITATGGTLGIEAANSRPFSITDSTVTAEGGTIGIFASSGSVTISGSEVTATGTNSNGISCGALVVKDESNVTFSGAGLGTQCSSVSVTNSSVTASGTKSIGLYATGKIEINSGVVDATGEGYAILSNNMITLGDDMYVETPELGTLNDAGKFVVENDGSTPAEHAVIKESHSVILEFGEGHEAFVKEHFGTEMTVTSPYGNPVFVSAAEDGSSSVRVRVLTDNAGVARKGLEDVLMEAAVDQMDGNERMSRWVGTKTSYTDALEYDADMDDLGKKTVTDGMVFYALWEKPAEIELNIKQPKCGTTVTAVDIYSALGHTDPFLEVGTSVGVECAPNKEGGNWLEGEDGDAFFAGTFTGDEEYYGSFSIRPTFGYYIPEDSFDNAVIENATVISKNYNNGHPGFRVKVKAVHAAPEDAEVVKPTCTEAGSRTYICEGCGRKTQEEIPALGHDWGEWKVTKEATETAEGEETRVCNNDPSHKETRAIPKLDPESKTCTIQYDLNGGTLDGKTGIIIVEAKKGSTITIPDAPEREGYTFTYWKGSEYYPGDSYIVEGDHTFTAQWKAEADKEYSDTDFDTSDSGNSSKSSKKSKGVDTGDAADLMGWILLAIIAETGAVYVYRRRRNF